MPQIINTNVSSINAQRNLNKSQSSLQTSLQRLSSGLRINSAKDDAAGLAISNRFTTQVRGLNVAVRNANDGISFAQTSESALDEITTSLQRIRDLAVQSANDTNSAADRQSLQEEVSQLVSEIDRIANTTTFNGNKVADGSISSLNFQIGANAGETVSVSGVDARASALGSQPGAVQSAASSLAAAAGASLGSFSITVGTGGTAVDVLSAANGGAINGSTAGALTDPTATDYGSGVAKSLAERINELRADGVEGLDGVYATAETTYDYQDVASGSAALSAASAYVGDGELANGDLTINGVDIGPVTIQEKDADGSLVSAINAKSATTGVTASVDENGRLSLTAEDGRDIVVTTQNNAADTLFDGGDNATVTDLSSDFKSGSVTISAQDTIAALSNTTATDVTNANEQAVGTVANADITTVSGANITIESIDSALAQIDSFRAGLGAIQNRFESTIRNLSAVSESLSAANSRIRDADFAAETAKLSKNQVLQQAGISVLAQANALPQQALSLLG
ncbi:MAG: flagellin [Pseudomonadota bacterium]|nr:flagellin [Pseudomonadota bacterium]MDY6920625.1 flagellin [Pseudomonadota bacterium]